MPGFIIAGFPTTEKYYRYCTFQQTVSDGLGTPPFKRKPNSTFSRLVRIPDIMAALHTPSVRADCTREVAARLEFLNGAEK